MQVESDINSSNIKTLSDKLVYCICIFCLLITGIKWSSGIQNHVDVLLADEAEYLRNGLNLFHIIAKNWGPTYNLWYKALSFINSNPVELYYLNYKIGAIAVGVLLFIFLVRYNIHITVAFLIAFCFLFSDVNINTWPRISHFVIIVLLIYFIAIKNSSSFINKLILFSAVTFILAFARPELLSIAMLLTAVSIAFSIYNYKTIVTRIPHLVLLFFVAGILFFVYGKPADSYSNINRIYIAFCQHYAIAYKVRTHSSMNAVIEWIDFTRPLFGDCKTVPEIFMKHFDLVIPHVLFVAKLYIVTFLNFVLNFVVPIYFIHKMKLKLALLIGLFVFIIFSFFYTKTRVTIVAKLKENAVVLLFAFVISIPSIGICAIIFPRQHYMMMQCVWVALLLGIILSVWLEMIDFKNFYALPLLVMFVFISPKADEFTTFQGMPDIKNLCTQKFIAYMNEQKWTKQHTIFSNILNVQMLFNKPENFKQFNTEYMLKQMPTNTKFNDILTKDKIDIILMNDALLEESRLKKDSTWQELTAHPENFNFKKVEYCKDCESYLLIKDY
ncbi:MAG TPA: hypothetical protein PK431_13590 [Chitinophagales bacterium]|nr:hypothetical protein [Chitinophagales bacterium]